jgi:ribosomal protein S27E
METAAMVECALCQEKSKYVVVFDCFPDFCKAKEQREERGGDPWLKCVQCLNTFHWECEVHSFHILLRHKHEKLTKKIKRKSFFMNYKCANCFDDENF